LKIEERETLLLLRQLHPETELAYELVQQFARMLRTRTGEKLDDWLAQVADSHLQELQSFALGIERDKLAVVAGLTLPQNNGLGDRKSQQVETRSRVWAMAELVFLYYASACFMPSSNKCFSRSFVTSGSRSS